MNGEIFRLLGAKDVFAAVEVVQKAGSPLDVARRYHVLVAELYWKQKDLPGVVAMGQAGIHYALGQSLDPGSRESESIRLIAKGIAYNVGSFTWPGWEEPGINPTASDVAFGRQCADLNLRLAIELKKPADKVSMAHWLIGAHLLVTSDFAAAIAQFQQAHDIIPANDPASKAMEPCNLGYLALAQACDTPSDPIPIARLEEILTWLRGRSDNDAKIYLAQLESARRLFLQPRLG